MSLHGSAGTSVPTSSTTKNFIHEHSLVGSVIINADIDKAVDTFGDSQTEVDIAGSDTALQSFNTQGILGTQPDVYKIGQSLTDASGYNYIFITEDPKVNGTIWGNEAEFVSNPNRTIKIIGGFFQYNGTNWSSATNWEYNDYSPTIHKVNADGTIGDAIDTSNNNLVVDNNQSDFIQLRFTDTSNCSKYRVRLRAAANEYIEVEKIEMYRSLAGFTDDETDRAFGSVTMQNDNNNFQTKFENVLDGTLQNPDSVYQIRIAIPDSFEHSALSSINIYFSDDHNIDSNTNYLIYTLGADWIADNQGYGWKTVTLKLEDIAIQQNTPVIGTLVDVILEYNYNENLGSGNTNYNALQIDSINLVSDETGTWNGYYKFYYSWIYDRNQETGYYEFLGQGNGIYLTNERLSAKALIRELSTGGFGSRGKRITGANIYFKEYDIDRDEVKYDDPFLLLKLDFEKGAIKPLGTELNAWALGTTATDHYTHTALQFIDPSLSNTFSINAGYDYDPLNTIEEIRFRSAISLNRRMYYGNVDVLWEKFEGETNYRRNLYGDRIYKSLPNKPDVIPSENFLDVDINDGDEVTALASYADRLLVYKHNTMYLVNATKTLEYLEDTYKYMGVMGSKSVCYTNNGVAWVNLDGAYFYNGEAVINLIDKKLSRDLFASHLTVGTDKKAFTIAYEPKEKHLVIYADNGNGWVFNFISQSWSKSDTGLDDSANKRSNLELHDNTITQASIDSSNDVTFHSHAIDTTASNSVVFDIRTKDYSITDIGQRKDIKAIYLTYKGTMSGARKVSVEYFADKQSSAIAVNPSDLTTSPSGFTTIKVVPTPKSSGRKVHTIQVRIKSSGDDGLAFRNFELHDISIIYREKSIK